MGQILKMQHISAGPTLGLIKESYFPDAEAVLCLDHSTSCLQSDCAAAGPDGSWTGNGDQFNLAGIRTFVFLPKCHLWDWMGRPGGRVKMIVAELEVKLKRKFCHNRILWDRFLSERFPRSFGFYSSIWERLKPALIYHSSWTEYYDLKQVAKLLPPQHRCSQCSKPYKRWVFDNSPSRFGRGVTAVERIKVGKYSYGFDRIEDVCSKTCRSKLEAKWQRQQQKEKRAARAIKRGREKLKEVKAWLKNNRGACGSRRGASTPDKISPA